MPGFNRDIFLNVTSKDLQTYRAKCLTKRFNFSRAPATETRQLQ